MTNIGLGFVPAAIAVVFFGSNFVPVKKFDTGDGVFFQWVMCTAIWIAGLIVQLIQGSPPFQPLAMLGGVLWCTGNIMAVPIVQMIGLSLGLLLWGTSNLVMGWASGTFGLFGLQRQTVPFPALNYIGVVFAVGSIAVFVFVKSDTSKQPKLREENEKLIPTPVNVNETEVEEQSVFERLPPVTKRILGIVLAIISGCFYGVNFDPPQYLIDHSDRKNGLDYVFSHFCGIFLASTFYFLVYCAVKKNRPYVNPQCILPGFVSGTLWAIAQICWFIANSILGFVVSFPIITTGPGLVAALWGIFAFRNQRS